ncbi:MAG: PspC domain-containing protein [Gammaproteobacteria bacterium]|nr:PspC domain-containing protein [Gammaproteobacteria bacterium]
MNPSSSGQGKLYRSAENGLLFGVCAGIAQHFAVAPNLVRFTAVLLQLLFFPTWILYLLLVFLLPRQESPQREGEVREEFRNRLRQLEAEESRLLRRLTEIEAFVTSERFEMEMKVGGLRGK